MMLESVILAVITTKPEKFAGGAPLFACETTEELEFVANNLEAILDGIAHRLQENVYIIVKH
ncbi:capping complex subunit for YIEGIA [Bacillus wiedmannii]|uniref:capping complex subunit for YIEGIA n=1 Tax=Bacillus wiedmannii TaxID=1890302 RepID=UPI003D973D6B